MAARFEEWMLPIDGQVADEWGRVMDRARRAGRPMSSMDDFIAATALTHDLTLVTRNVGDFGASVRCCNPWARS